MADARDLKSRDLKQSCGFESRHRHHLRTNRVIDQSVQLKVAKHYETKSALYNLIWVARLRCLTRDHKRSATTFAHYHWLAFSCLMLNLFFAKFFMTNSRLRFANQSQLLELGEQIVRGPFTDCGRRAV
jgi:hypothetical protein